MARAAKVPWDGDDRIASTAAPCPFCGCTAAIIETVEPRDPEPIYHAECWCCGARGPVEDTGDKALLSWNTRAEAIERGELIVKEAE